MRVDWCVSSWFRIKNTHSHTEAAVVPRSVRLLRSLTLRTLSLTLVCSRTPSYVFWLPLRVHLLLVFPSSPSVCAFSSPCAEIVADCRDVIRPLDYTHTEGRGEF